jgi:hypothetical protein
MIEKMLNAGLNEIRKYTSGNLEVIGWYIKRHTQKTITLSIGIGKDKYYSYEVLVNFNIETEEISINE